MPDNFETLVNSGDESVYRVQSNAPGPKGSLPLTAQMLIGRPSGDIFGLSMDAGMGWTPSELGRKEFLILSTQGGIRAADGTPVALGYHTGHWEVGLLMQEAAEELKARGAIPFAAFCSDPCDGRTQGTVGMYDSLAYRNDAAQVFRRLIRSLPTRKGVMGVATCDKGLPAMMMALAAMHDLPTVLVPGGVTLPPTSGEDAGKIQSIGARFAHGQISLEEAAELACHTCATPGGGCQFLGTAATSQVVGEALGLELPHSALAPSGQPVWLDMARRSARALLELEAKGLSTKHILTEAAIHNAMAVHAAFGGSTNLLLHIPAIAYSAGIRRPTIEDWIRFNRRVPRIVDVLPNGPKMHPTVRVFLAGGVPEVMLHLRRLKMLEESTRTVSRLVGEIGTPAAYARAVVPARRRSTRGGDSRSADGAARGPYQHSHVSARQSGSGRLGHQKHGHRSERGGRRRGLSQNRPRARVHPRARRDPGHQGPRTRCHQARRCFGADLPRPAGRRHGGDLSDHRRAPAFEFRQARRGHYRRPLFRCLNRGLHRPCESRGPSRRSDRQGTRRRPHSHLDRPQPARGQH